jgi:hypothetical protein
LVLYEAEKDEEVIKELVTETDEQTRLRFMKRMYALINNIAADKQKEPIEIKNSLKDFLRRKKIMKKSLKELDTNSLASAIYYLQSEYGEEINQEE